ncbi:MAG TPA: hypothetical protein VL049_29745 [Candidatus Dormibacteraeota bacterium]|nr:hypothetical protein [Candidatus Dormibacteraeota bacterium]
MDHEDINENVNGSRVAGHEPGARDAATEIEELRRRIEALQAGADSRVRAGLREHPFAALGAAVAAGFILGRAIRRL